MSFSLTITTNSDTKSVSTTMLPAVITFYFSEYGLDTYQHVISLVKWSSEETGSVSILNAYSNPIFSATTDVTTWTPVSIEEGHIYSLSSTGGNLAILLGDEVHTWNEAIALRFYSFIDRKLLIYPCPEGYRAMDIVYTAPTVGGGIFTFGPDGEGPEQFTPRLSKKTYYNDCFATTGVYTLTFEHSTGKETCAYGSLGRNEGTVKDYSYRHKANVYVSESTVVEYSCNEDEIKVSFYSSLHCLVDEYGTDNEFALTASLYPFMMCLKKDTLFRIRALSFEGGHLRVTMNDESSDYDLNNFGEGWLNTGTGKVTAPENYEGYYELTDDNRNEAIPEGVQTLFLNGLTVGSYKEIDTTNFPQLQFLVALDCSILIGLKAESHSNLRLVNVTMSVLNILEDTVFTATDCSQLASIHLTRAHYSTFTIQCTFFVPTSS